MSATRHPVDAQVDLPDTRDVIYRPSLVPVRAELDPRRDPLWWSAGRVRDQGTDPSCTGHAVAAAVDHLLAIDRRKGEAFDRFEPTLARLDRPYASALMLYGNAQLHDEWNGEGYSGSSLRGAIKGFRHNGACSIETARQVVDTYRRGADRVLAPQWRWHTNALVARNACKVLLGAYYRVRPQLSDMHCALGEAEVLVATARIHRGWYELGADGRIPFDRNGRDGGRYHAFVVLGYSEAGFIVQNSWGRGWGAEGVAIWTYEDWSRNVADVWALRLAAPFSDAQEFSVGLRGVSGIAEPHQSRFSSAAPTRLDVLGHLLPVVDARLERHGPFHHDPQTIAETVDIIRRRHSEEKAAATGERFAAAEAFRRRGGVKPSDLKYRHVLIQILAGGRSQEQAARMVRALHPVYRENGIYPVFLLWEAELFLELRRQVETIIDAVVARTQGAGRQRDALVANLIEVEATGLPARLRRELERSMRRFFRRDGARVQAPGLDDAAAAQGIATMRHFFAALAGRHRDGSLSYHLAAHDLGARFVTGLLAHAFPQGAVESPVFSTLHLISPLLEEGDFLANVLPAMTRAGEGRVNRHARRRNMFVENAHLWCLDEPSDRRDRFHPDYPGSWPGLWSRVMATLLRREIEEGVEDPEAGLRRLDASGGGEPMLPDGPGRPLPRIRTLALRHYASHAVEAARALGYAPQLHVVPGPEPDEVEPAHFTLDARLEVLNSMLATILGDTPVRRSFGPLDWEASR